MGITVIKNEKFNQKVFAKYSKPKGPPQTTPTPKLDYPWNVL